MSDFWHGIHLPNSAEMPDLGLIQRGRFNAAKCFDFTPHEVIQRVRGECGIDRWLVRLWWPGRPPEPCGYVDAMAKRVEALLSDPLQKCHVVIEIHNEPNHCAGIEGWGRDNQYAHDFLSWYMAVYYLLARRFPYLAVCLPGLANGDAHNDMAWYARLTPAIETSERVGVHTYWQGDNHLNGVWGTRYERLSSMIPREKMFITEYGDSSFQAHGFDASERARADRVYEWLYHVRKDGIGGAFWFLLGGTDDWRGFRLTEQIAAAMAAAVGREV